MTEFGKHSTVIEIERAIAEIEGSGFGRDQVREETMRIALIALKEKLERKRIVEILGGEHGRKD